MTSQWRRPARAGYWGLVALVFILSVIQPITPGGLEPSDKVNHFAAFYVLELGAAVLFPRRPLWFSALLLVAFGGFIEIIQGLPFVGRDRSLLDWLTDAAAIACAAAPLALSRLRTTAGDDKPVS
jgi:hypothetical protein